MASREQEPIILINHLLFALHGTKGKTSSFKISLQKHTSKPPTPAQKKKKTTHPSPTTSNNAQPTPSKPAPHRCNAIQTRRFRHNARHNIYTAYRGHAFILLCITAARAPASPRELWHRHKVQQVSPWKRSRRRGGRERGASDDPASGQPSRDVVAHPHPSPVTRAHPSTSTTAAQRHHVHPNHPLVIRAENNKAPTSGSLPACDRRTSSLEADTTVYGGVSPCISISRYLLLCRAVVLLYARSRGLCAGP